MKESPILLPRGNPVYPTTLKMFYPVNKYSKMNILPSSSPFTEIYFGRLYNDVSHWLGANLESALDTYSIQDAHRCIARPVQRTYVLPHREAIRLIPRKAGSWISTSGSKHFSLSEDALSTRPDVYATNGTGDECVGVYTLLSWLSVCFAFGCDKKWNQ